MALLDKLFQLMAEKKASDIYITAGAPIQIKIEGETLPINQQLMVPAVIKQMIYEMLSAEQIARFERDKELNLSFGRSEYGNFRTNLFWQRGSIAAVIRYIQGDIPSLESLALPPVLSEVVMEKRGLVLVVGATGSGKSTTLASMLDHRNNNRSGHILTVEDPVEFLFKHRKSVVNQREVGIDTHSWHEALRNAMRQAPDCILIGEIRDRETMEAAMAYSQTGHLCLATLHANNAYHALNRIVNFFPLENRPLLYLDLAVALKCIVSQRLVRKPDGMRTPAVEILMNSRHVAELIERGELSEIKEAMEQSLTPGSRTFEQDLVRLYTEGTIDIDEAMANADSPSNLSWLINNAKSGKEEKELAPAQSGPQAFEFQQTADDGTSFSEFALDLGDTPDR